MHVQLAGNKGVRHAVRQAVVVLDRDSRGAQGRVRRARGRGAGTGGGGGQGAGAAVERGGAVVNGGPGCGTRGGCAGEEGQEEGSCLRLRVIQPIPVVSLPLSCPVSGRPFPPIVYFEYAEGWRQLGRAAPRRLSPWVTVQSPLFPVASPLPPTSTSGSPCPSHSRRTLRRMARPSSLQPNSLALTFTSSRVVCPWQHRADSRCGSASRSQGLT